MRVAELGVWTPGKMGFVGKLQETVNSFSCSQLQYDTFEGIPYLPTAPAANQQYRQKIMVVLKRMSLVEGGLSILSILLGIITVAYGGRAAVITVGNIGPVFVGLVGMGSAGLMYLMSTRGQDVSRKEFAEKFRWHLNGFCIAVGLCHIVTIAFIIINAMEDPGCNISSSLMKCPLPDSGGYALAVIDMIVAIFVGLMGFILLFFFSCCRRHIGTGREALIDSQYEEMSHLQHWMRGKQMEVEIGKGSVVKPGHSPEMIRSYHDWPATNSYTEPPPSFNYNL